MSRFPAHILLGDEGTVTALSALVSPKYRALVLLLRYSGLRWDEAVALRRRRCFVAEGSIEVAERVVEKPSGPRLRTLSGGSSLSRDSWVSVRDGVREALAQHLETYVGPERNALVFTNARGGLLVRAWFEETEWFPALAALGVPSEGIEILQTARLWASIQEATALRASYCLRGGGAGA